MKINIQMEIIFAVGIILFTLSILIYGAILKRLLGLVGRKGIWIFPVIGGILLLFGAGIHFYRILFYSDALSHADPADLFPLLSACSSTAPMKRVPYSLRVCLLCWEAGFITDG